MMYQYECRGSLGIVHVIVLRLMTLPGVARNNAWFQLDVAIYSSAPSRTDYALLAIARVDFNECGSKGCSA